MEQTTALEKKKSGTPAKQSSQTVESYTELRRKVEQAFARGLERAKYAVEQEKIRTTWEVGRLMDEHILHHKERAGYREKVIVRLARDVNQSRTFLYFTLELFRAYPIVLPVGQLTLTDYRDLLSINDEVQRKALAVQAAKQNWSRAQLREKIKEVKRGLLGKPVRSQEKSVSRNRIIPKRGLLHTYRIVRAENLQGEKKLLIDLGFSSFIELPARLKGKLKEGDVVQATAKQSSQMTGNRFEKIKATRRDLFTYEARVERVVDGDTLWVWIDLGFGNWTRQKLRLRGIEAPELGTEAGRRAKRFVEKQLKNVPLITVATTKPDKYDRYLSEIFYLQDVYISPGAAVVADGGKAVVADGTGTSSGKKDIYLNQLLLDKGYAKLKQGGSSS